jgi:hypothetical protein
MDRCAYLKALPHSEKATLSENEFLLEILNKEKIYLHLQHEVWQRKKSDEKWGKTGNFSLS